MVVLLFFCCCCRILLFGQCLDGDSCPLLPHSWFMDQEIKTTNNQPTKKNKSSVVDVSLYTKYNRRRHTCVCVCVYVECVCVCLVCVEWKVDRERERQGVCVCVCVQVGDVVVVVGVKPKTKKRRKGIWMDGVIGVCVRMREWRYYSLSLSLL